VTLRGVLGPSPGANGLSPGVKSPPHAKSSLGRRARRGECYGFDKAISRVFFITREFGKHLAPRSSSCHHSASSLHLTYVNSNCYLSLLNPSESNQSGGLYEDRSPFLFKWYNNVTRFPPVPSTSARVAQQRGRHRCQLTRAGHSFEPWQRLSFSGQYIDTSQDADSRGHQFQYSLLGTWRLHYPFRTCLILVQGEVLLV
jgi:hypothetical protein